MRLWRAIPLFITTAWGCNSSADTSRARADYVADVPDIPMREYGARRAAALEAFSDGILVLHARPAAKTMEQWGFVQDPTFQYFSGLTEVPGAILALDGPEGASHLFLPPAPRRRSHTLAIGDRDILPVGPDRKREDGDHEDETAPVIYQGQHAGPAWWNCARSDRRS